MRCNYILPRQFEYGFTYCTKEKGHEGEDHVDGYGVVGGTRWVPIDQYFCSECGTSATAEDEAVIEALETVLENFGDYIGPKAVMFIRDLIERHR